MKKLFIYFTLAFACLGAQDFNLSKITVEEETIDNLGSEGHSNILSPKFLRAIIGSDGGIDRALKTIAGLQFSESSLSVKSAIDIKPSSFSISGGKYYENFFGIDGINTSNRNNPTSKSNNINNIEEHEQSFFIDSSLIESIEVHKSNISARYSGFTGGVVDLKTKNPKNKLSAKVHYSQTSDKQTKYHIITQPPDPQSTTQPPKIEKPSFKRKRYGGHIHLPVADGMFLSFNNQESSTPIVSLRKTLSQTQENQNYTLKLAKNIDDIRTSFLINYSPFSSKNYIVNVKSSAFKTNGGGINANAKLNYIDKILNIGFSHNKNERKAQNIFYTWQNSKKKNWGYHSGISTSMEGGYGDLISKTSKLNVNYEDKLYVGELRFTYGTQTSYAKSTFERPNNAYIYSKVKDKNSLIQCREQPDCSSKDQYFYERRIYPKDLVDVDLIELGAFSETNFALWRMFFVVGLRYDWDEFLQNHNIAPRMRGSLDVFANEKTIINFGLNRYYSASLLAYKLNEAKKPFVSEYRGLVANIVGNWEPNSDRGSYKYVFKDVKTPYSDEVTLGLAQSVFGGKLDITGVLRNSKDEFSKTITPLKSDGYRYHLMSNKGHSEHKSLNVGYYLPLDKTHINLSASWSKSYTSNENYNLSIDEAKEVQWVWYDGKRIQYKDLDILRSDFARSLVYNISLAHEFSKFFTISSNTRVLGKTPQIVSTGKQKDGNFVQINGDTVRERLTIYKKTHKPQVTLTDIKANLRVPLGNGIFEASVDVNNVFDARTHTVSDYASGIELGRSFWIACSYEF